MNVLPFQKLRKRISMRVQNHQKPLSALNNWGGGHLFIACFSTGAAGFIAGGHDRLGRSGLSLLRKGSQKEG